VTKRHLRRFIVSYSIILLGADTSKNTLLELRRKFSDIPITAA